MRVGLIAPIRHPLTEPFAGGMEAHTAELARALRSLGHDVAVFGAEGSDVDLVRPGDHLAATRLSEASLRDVSSAPEWFMTQHSAYLSLMLRLAEEGPHRFDVLHDNALHYLTLSLARLVRVPTVATLHTPPTPWAESALDGGVARRTAFRAVSFANARSWHPVLGTVPVIYNGVDTDSFVLGLGGGTPVWSGRLVPEKGADHAIAAARRAGTGLVLAGPIADPEWFRCQIEPVLGTDVEYAGHLNRRELAILLGGASAALVTARWEEPYGLVAAEALACGTPVAAYDRGAAAEILDEHTGVLAPADDVTALARALVRATALRRSEARARAVSHWSSVRMAHAYSDLYAERATSERVLPSSRRGPRTTGVRHDRTSARDAAAG